jgi:photosynthetic reaction center H subunit
MQTGAITNYIDVAQLALYAFWIFFAGLIYYLRGEDKREGYPLETEARGRRGPVQGFPPMPKPKTYLLQHGGIRVLPNYKNDQTPLAAVAGNWIGAPIEPTGDPMIDGVGPAAYANRTDEPDLTYEGDARVVPLRSAPRFGIDAHDPDPRGMEVLAIHRAHAGTVTDIWIDRSELVVRYYEVAVTTPAGTIHVLLPSNLTRIEARRRAVLVKAITASQFATAPVTKHPDFVTLLEEDRIMAYFASGHLYGLPSRQEPLL